MLLEFTSPDSQVEGVVEALGGGVEVVETRVHPAQEEGGVALGSDVAPGLTQLPHLGEVLQRHVPVACLQVQQPQVRVGLYLQLPVLHIRGTGGHGGRVPIY